MYMIIACSDYQSDCVHEVDLINNCGITEYATTWLSKRAT